MKDVVFFHRSYRVLPESGRGRGIDLLALILPVEILILAFHERILALFVEAVRAILAWCGLATGVGHVPFLPWVIREIPILAHPPVFPSGSFALGNLIVSVAVVVALPLLRFLPRPMVIYFVFLGAINGASSVFFLAWPRQFPYDIAAFSSLYMQLTLGLWLFLPVLVGMVLHVLPGGLGRKFLVLAAIMGYSVVFGIVRYAVFLWLLDRFSVLYMAVMFFALGPFADFVYVVSIYSLHLNRLAVELKRTPETWQWLS